MMRYPTMKEIEQADHMTLAYWVRFLPSPGAGAIGADKAAFEAALTDEAERLARIMERFHAKGGMTPTISKTIGW